MKHLTLKSPRAFFLFTVLFFTLLLPGVERKAGAFDFADIPSIGAAYLTHFFFHEVGHAVVADEVGAQSHRIAFFVRKEGKFYPGLSSYERIPDRGKTPYALGGERMAGFTFDYALGSYRQEPTPFNMALMFFSNFDFLAYTLMANYISPENRYYDPNLYREETGMSKWMLLSAVTAKTLLNTFRLMDRKARFAPTILLDRDKAVFAISFEF